MTPPPNYDHTRRRAEDVYKVIEDDVFPRIMNLEGDVKNLVLKGCAHRNGDLLRTQAVEANTLRIFERIEVFGKDLAAHQIDMTRQLGEVRLTVEKKSGGLRGWVYGMIIAALVVLLGFFAADYAKDIEAGLKRLPTIGGGR